MTREPLGPTGMAVTSHHIDPVPGAWDATPQRMALVPGAWGTVTGVELSGVGAEVMSYVFDPPVLVPAGATLEMVGFGDGLMHFRVDGREEVRPLGAPDGQGGQADG